jgi:uncharacterized protein (DUF2141 family)
MKYKLLICSLFLITLSISLLSQSTSRGTLEIKFTEIRNSKGKIAIGINTLQDGWPRKPQIEFNWKKENLVDGVFTVKIPDLPFGIMAISALDDENSDLEMDMFLGIPKEGFGFSMDPPFKLSAPKFEDCSFLLNQPYQQITIRFRYTGKGK